MNRQGQEAGGSDCRRRAGVVLAVLALALMHGHGWAADTDEAGGLEGIVVTAARGATLIRDEPLRVEAASGPGKTGKHSPPAGNPVPPAHRGARGGGPDWSPRPRRGR